jgi:hypothetical protein
MARKKRLVVEGATMEAIELLAESAGLTPGELVQRALRREDAAQQAEQRGQPAERTARTVTDADQALSADEISRAVPLPYITAISSTVAARLAQEHEDRDGQPRAWLAMNNTTLAVQFPSGPYRVIELPKGMTLGFARVMIERILASASDVWYLIPPHPPGDRIIGTFHPVQGPDHILAAFLTALGAAMAHAVSTRSSPLAGPDDADMYKGPEGTEGPAGTNVRDTGEGRERASGE